MAIADRLQGIPGVTAQVIENDGRSRPPEAAACFVTITDGARLSAKEIVTRLKKVKPPVPRYISGVMGKYARHVSSASEGAITS